MTPVKVVMVDVLVHHGFKMSTTEDEHPVAETQFRIRTDKVDSCGKVTLRHGTRLFHIGIGRRHKGKRIWLYIAGLDVRVVTWNGELLRQFTLDTSKAYQPSGLPTKSLHPGPMRELPHPFTR
jgi:hypothetical protein